MKRVYSWQLLSIATVFLLALWCPLKAAHAQVRGFDMETRLGAVSEFPDKSFTIYKRTEFISDDLTINSFMRVYADPSSGRSGRFTFDRLHLSDCLFFDFDAPLPAKTYGAPQRPPYPPYSCAQLEDMLDNRDGPYLYIKTPTFPNPTITIIIRHLTCDPGKRLYVDASGPLSIRKRDGSRVKEGQGHVKYLINESAAASDCFRIIGDEKITVAGKQYESERTSFTSFGNRSSLSKGNAEAASYTTVLALHRIGTKMEAAIIRGDLISLAAMFNEAEVLAGITVLPGHAVRQSEILKQINNARARVEDMHAGD